MENNQPKKRNAGLIAVIALLLIITTIASCVGLYAWAKYTTRLPDGQTTAQVAKWHFELRNGTSQVESGKQLLALTRTDGYGHVATGELAPGTFGEFLLEIDTTGTEVTLVYDVDITLEDCPVNLIFYKDSAHTQVLEKEAVSEGVVKLHWSKHLSLDSTADNYVNKVHLEKIYWDWPYETLDQQGNAAAGDAQDKLDNGKEVQMNIVVTGTEEITASSNTDPEEPSTDPEEPSYAADSVYKQSKAGNIRRWDSVDYKQGSLTTESIELPSGALLDEKIIATEAGNWVVLDVNETTGELKIIPKRYSDKGLTLSGMEGYNHAIEAIDKVASIYLNSSYAKSSKSLNVDDLNKLTGYNPAESAEVPSATSFKSQYGIGKNLNIEDYGSEAIRNFEGVTSDTTKYEYYTYDYEIDAPKEFEEMNCWLASRCIELESGYCGFSVRYLQSEGVYGNAIFGVNAYGTVTPSEESNLVIPVVTLKPTVHINEVDGVWKLSL